MNFYDILLGRQLCCDKTEYETLVVTENGEYSAPQGKAWNKVVAEVSGGGDSDFSTVKATIKNNLAVPFTVSIPNLYDAGEYGVFLNPTVTINGTGEQVVDAILYKNAGSGFVDPITFGNTITVSGDAEYDGGYIEYTGDFTITYSAS